MARHFPTEVAEAARTPTDWMRLGVFVGKQRRYEDALALTRRAKFGDAEGASIVANNLAWFWAKMAGGASSYRSGGLVSRDDAAPWLRSLDEAASTLEKDQSENWEMWFMYCVGTRAEILRLVGDLDGALASFESAAAKYLLSPERLLCRAQVHAVRGANAEAAGDLEAALRQLHPESEDAAEARELLKSLSPFG